jgi:molecular chaperone DnaK (HSP70)
LQKHVLNSFRDAEIFAIIWSNWHETQKYSSLTNQNLKNNFQPWFSDFQVAMNSKNTVYNVKRFLGRTTEDVKVQSTIVNSSFNIMKGKNNNVIIEVDFRSEKRQFRPEELTAMVLYKMKVIAGKLLGETITDAVISVPALFGTNQRQATLDAGKIAGLNVIRLINEPTAAALAYGFDSQVKVINMKFGNLEKLILYL